MLPNRQHFYYLRSSAKSASLSMQNLHTFPIQPLVIVKFLTDF